MALPWRPSICRSVRILHQNILVFAQKFYALLDQWQIVIPVGFVFDDKIPVEALAVQFGKHALYVEFALAEYGRIVLFGAEFLLVLEMD